MSNIEALEIIKNTYIERFNNVVELIKEEEYDDVIELAKLRGKAEAYKDVICSILTAKEFIV